MTGTSGAVRQHGGEVTWFHDWKRNPHAVSCAGQTRHREANKRIFQLSCKRTYNWKTDRKNFENKEERK
jgi:hypothetical protein